MAAPLSIRREIKVIRATDRRLESLQKQKKYSPAPPSDFVQSQHGSGRRSTTFYKPEEAWTSVEAMTLEEEAEAERRDGYRKRSTLDHQLAPREGVLPLCGRAIWPRISDRSKDLSQPYDSAAVAPDDGGRSQGGGQMAFPPGAEQKPSAGNPSLGVPAVVHGHLCEGGCIHLAWDHARGCAVV